MSEENDDFIPHVWKKEEEVALQRRNQERKISARKLREHWDRMEAWDKFKGEFSKRLCNLLFNVDKSNVNKLDDSFEFLVDGVSYIIPITPPKYTDEILRDNLSMLELKFQKID